MRMVIRKWFWAWDFDREEKWLAECAAKGLSLTSVCLCRYEFEEGVPGAYNVRLEMLEHPPTHPESMQYIRFLEETGAEHIGSVNRWIYLRRPAEMGPFDLFSDNASRVRHLGRILSLLTVPVLICFGIGVYNIIFGCTFDSTVNILVGGIDVLVSLLMSVGLYKLYRRRSRLKKEQQIYE